jgi:site-specific DNA-methyltransferase (adenine-specific)
MSSQRALDFSPESESPSESTIEILPPADVLTTLTSVNKRVTTTILDPWYNKGVGGVHDGYEAWLKRVVHAAAGVSEHVFVWGFPEIVHCVLDDLPKALELVAWLTWYYKNCPSVIRGWRSAQNACLHLARKGARLYPEHFLTPAQERLRLEGKLRYMPGPPSVIEAPLNVGFVGVEEQTGHPSQKPLKAFEPLVLMTTAPGDWVLDPTCGSGTTGVVCRSLGRHAILCDLSEEYIQLTERRLGQSRKKRRSSRRSIS